MKNVSCSKIFDIFDIFLKIYQLPIHLSSTTPFTSFSAISICFTYSKMNTDTFRMTFGAELEFVVDYNPDDYHDELLAGEGKLWPADFPPSLQHKYGVLVRRHMIQILNENGFSTNGYRCKDFSKWTVDTDGTVESFDNSENWYAIELKTPVLHCDNTALEKVQAVVKLLDSKFRLSTNKSCGLHVHVGNEDRGFTMNTLKNFCRLITVFERQLNSLHPPDRIQNSFAKPTHMAFHQGASFAEKLSIIDDLKTKEELIIRFHFIQYQDYDKDMAFNFFHLQERSDLYFEKPLNTIEFRQHRGTLDPQLITNWVTVARNLVEISHNDTGFRHLIEKHMNNTEYTVIDLFKDLDLLGLAEFYASRVYSH